jgi:biotin transporter BioY
MLFSMIGCCIVWIGMTTATALFSESGETDKHAAKASIAMIFIFGAVYSVGLTPLQALYPVEVLSFEMRAKGMAFSALAVNAGGMMGQFAWPIALEKIKWKTYIVFIVWDFVQSAIFYFMMPETKNRTLEELDRIFEAKNPVKASLIHHKVALASDGTVLASDDV